MNPVTKIFLKYPYEMVRMGQKSLINATLDPALETLIKYFKWEQYKWGRLLIGGKWEQWTVDKPSGDTANRWFHVDEFTEVKQLQATTVGYEANLDDPGDAYWRDYSPSPFCEGSEPIAVEYWINNANKVI